MDTGVLQVFAVPMGAAPEPRPGGYAGKRLLDIVLSAALLILCAPVIGAIWLLLRVETGQGFARRIRIGRGGAPISCLVFHTARPIRAVRSRQGDLWARLGNTGAEPAAGRVGIWVRRLGLAGLPMLWTVLRGDMSLVGPRPATRAELARYGLARSVYLAMRPGLIGLADARPGGRFCDRVHDDLRYSQIAGPWVDLSLIAGALTRRDAVGPRKAAGFGPMAPMTGPLPFPGASPAPRR
ncbi:sugar transferase [Rhodovulum kholense]|uniref:Lipopolysaccharide/colanic/teichoic acid biosynthesis glycosyltransferase n=1 Tax=Rhodovulum kholense TaxID=453584 RepID=A0A8E3ASX1_9RHOB|nr:sugar transferase [Rhodovulum kholense]PTW52175.1 lipopolysaccharide/colanic/teichoic acid biosynthesis glycosyltransferase [Rhodovulum kholense]